MKIGIVLGSILEARVGEAVARWIADSASGRPDVTYEIIDLKEFDVPLLTAALPPGAANRQYDDERVTRWSRAIDSCDAFVFVTAEYNHSVPGAFKNAVDSLGPEWIGKPIAFVAYGADGGVRAVEAWRTVVANFSMVDVRAQVSLGLFTDFGEDGFAPMERRAGELDALFGQLESMTARLAPGA